MAPIAGNYQVSLRELDSAEACHRRLVEVMAVKSSWVDQRVLDDLRRALQEVTKFRIALVEIDPR